PAPVPAPASTWQMDRAVVVMRHGIRPPTKAAALPAGMAPAPWPAWDVGWGELTHHGAKAVALLGRFDGARYARLLGAGCPATGAVHAVADVDQRTRATAAAYLAALKPGCQLAAESLADGAVDPRFSPFEANPLADAPTALASARAALPQGGEGALDRALAGQWHQIDAILDCHSPACSIASRPTALDVARGRVKLSGALALGGSFAETLALEYADGKPLAEVGWGRAGRAQITQLLALHAGEFALTARPPVLARAGARALLAEVAGALTAARGPRFSLFVGHDTNLAVLGGALGLHWQARQFAPDDPPPGAALLFERWHDGHGHYRLTIALRSQSLDEMRDLTAPGAGAVTVLRQITCAGHRGCTTGALGAALGQP
ncbi:MAG TPA: histidine-type phosphatase, partial [Novosphingobium sp.]|nr:histidine-type phosphatase [Novosphingobium sp.]